MYSDVVASLKVKISTYHSHVDPRSSKPPLSSVLINPGKVLCVFLCHIQADATMLMSLLVKDVSFHLQGTTGLHATLIQNSLVAGHHDQKESTASG